MQKDFQPFFQLFMLTQNINKAREFIQNDPNGFKLYPKTPLQALLLQHLTLTVLSSLNVSLLFYLALFSKQ